MDFVALLSRGFPHLTTEIFSQLSAPELESCRLVCKTWKNYLDQERLIKWAKPSGTLWAGPNRSILARKVLSLPHGHTTNAFSYDPVSGKTMVFHSENEREGETYVRSIHSTHQKKELFNFWAPFNPAMPPRNHIRISQAEEETNPLQGFHVDNTLFLKDYAFYVGSKQR